MNSFAQVYQEQCDQMNTSVREDILAQIQSQVILDSIKDEESLANDGSCSSYDLNIAGNSAAYRHNRFQDDELTALTTAIVASKLSGLCRLDLSFNNLGNYCEDNEHSDHSSFDQGSKLAMTSLCKLLQVGRLLSTEAMTNYVYHRAQALAKSLI